MNDLPIPPNATRTPPAVIAAIVGVSAAASLFLFWLVYCHAPVDVAGTRLLFLFIRSGRVLPHRNAMFAAFVFSSAFLVTYITNHALHGDMRFHGAGGIRAAYFALLISHIGLSVLALPMILVTFFLSLTGRFPAHKRLARYTFPVWLYVSVTGVVVYGMLAAYR